MLKETITFVDYNDVEHTEDYNFHLSRKEIAEINLRFPEGLEEYLKKISEDKDGQKIMELFELFITKAYGIKSEDGMTFKKTPELTQAFIDSPAYEELFMTLVTDDVKAAAFMQGILPAALVEAATKAQPKVAKKK